MTARSDALGWWWELLDDAGRADARALASGAGQYLPSPLLHDLVAAGVIVVAEGYFTSFPRGLHDFPIPRDVRAYILQRAR